MGRLSNRSWRLRIIDRLDWSIWRILKSKCRGWSCRRVGINSSKSRSFGRIWYRTVVSNNKTHYHHTITKAKIASQLTTWKNFASKAAKHKNQHHHHSPHPEIQCSQIPNDLTCHLTKNLNKCHLSQID